MSAATNPVSESTEISDNNEIITRKSTIEKELESLGCCKLCTQRYLGISDSSHYRRIAEIEMQNPMVDSEQKDFAIANGCNPPKIQKKTPCIVCLGLLEEGIQEEWLAKVSSEVAGKYTDPLSVCLNISLPICAQLRAYSLWYYLQKKFPEFYNLLAKLKPECINMKAVWKWVTSDSLKARLYPAADWSSNGLLSIQVNTCYEDDQSECSLLFNHLLNKKKGNRRKCDILSKTSLDLACCEMNIDEFQKIFQCPPMIPSKSLKIKSVECQHAALFVAGRYCKFSRTLSQTPWVIDGVRKTDTSVEELISGQIISYFSPDETRFSSSGREDVDVRCLGKGRPFAFELINPKKTIATKEMLRQIQDKINSSTSEIFVRDLQLVDKKDLSILKDGEETKTKHYHALCSLPEGKTVTQDILDTLNNYPVPIVLMQKTPVRVLHRRSNSCRKRTIFEMKATAINNSKDTPTSLFKLQVKTQAGTYVKEFVHGDLGRTVPSVSKILGIETDIKLLDVESVDVDWPMEISADIAVPGSSGIEKNFIRRIAPPKRQFIFKEITRE